MPKKNRKKQPPKHDQHVISEIAENLHLPTITVRQIVTKYLEQIENTVIAGDTFKLPGIGYIEGEKIKGRTYKNPKTKGNIWKPASLTIVYEPLPVLVDKINQAWPDVATSDKPTEGLVYENLQPPTDAPDSTVTVEKVTEDPAIDTTAPEAAREGPTTESVEGELDLFDADAADVDYSNMEL